MPAISRLALGYCLRLFRHCAVVARVTCWQSLVAIQSWGPGLETWCRFTRNTLVDSSAESGRMRWLIRCGEAPADADNVRPVGSRLWLYTNFDCNLHCDYCCVRSSPKAARRDLGLWRVQRIASEAAELDVKEIFLTGGEPFLLKDIGDILAAWYISGSHGCAY